MRGKRGKLLAVVLLGACGCGGEDADHLANATRLAAAKIDRLTDGAHGKLAHSVDAVRASWNDVALDARVAARLRWDKDLAGTSIQVRTLGNKVELTGAVTTLDQRQRAIHLARATVGVEDVIDGLTIPEP